MGYLLSKQFDIENIYYNELNTRGYKLHYKLPYCILNGITFNIDIKQYLTTKKKYYVEPTEASNDSFINKIDEKLKTFERYGVFSYFKDNSIYFRKNDITTKFLSNHKGSITLNIINMKKNAYHCYPIVYIV